MIKTRLCDICYEYKDFVYNGRRPYDIIRPGQCIIKTIYVPIKICSKCIDERTKDIQICRNGEWR